MLDFDRIATTALQTLPYRWAEIGALYAPADAAALAATFPAQGFARRVGYDEKDYAYEIRCLARMGGDAIHRPAQLSPAWRALAADLLSPRYRAAIARLTGLDLANAPFEANVFRYPAGGELGPHPDQRDKLVTHILYFNPSWNDADGGCLEVLRSAGADDVAARVSPVVGNSALLVRSDDSWHAVARVRPDCTLARLSVTATFYRPGCVSTMWPSWSHRLLHHYPRRALARLRGSARG